MPPIPRIDVGDPRITISGGSNLQPINASHYSKYALRKQKYSHCDALPFATAPETEYPTILGGRSAKSLSTNWNPEGTRFHLLAHNFSVMKHQGTRLSANDAPPAGQFAVSSVQTTRCPLTQTRSHSKDRDDAETLPIYGSFSVAYQGRS
ncbi:hypothetical protein GWI33_013352 [Rhynchophorus ferrugineus]|uniref:Uncharacterized protein n=1 Tax=Rhynchophorus ferrugineus TaxID=354439 RepID=A0A834MA21_RHYFE|nr:hypothetical protein GWI33_013352 [Rhynchophorus ferrugineus]